MKRKEKKLEDLNENLKCNFFLVIKYMPRKSKKEEGKELDERIAQLKLLVAEKKKKEKSKAVASNLKEEILGKKKAKAQETISKARDLDAGIARRMGDFYLERYIRDYDTEGKELKKQQEKKEQEELELKKQKEQEELELRQEKLMKEREDQVLKKKIYKLIREKYLSHKGPYITYSPPPGPMTTFGSILVEIDDYLMETQGRGIQTFFTKPQLLDIGKSFNRERMKKERIQRMNKARDDKAKEDYIKNNQVFKKYNIENLEDAKTQLYFWSDVLGKIDNKEKFDLRTKNEDGSAKYDEFAEMYLHYPVEPTKEEQQKWGQEKYDELLKGMLNSKKGSKEQLEYGRMFGSFDKKNPLKHMPYTGLKKMFTKQFAKIIKKELGIDLGSNIKGVRKRENYTFNNITKDILPTRGEIANFIDSIHTVLDRYTTITSKKKITKADYTSDEYDTDSTVASDYFSEIDSDSDFEGKLDREDKPLKQGRLTVVEDKPRVFIDDKSFIF